MEGSILFKAIKEQGLDVVAIDGNLHVTPRESITDNLRLAIRQHKASLLDFVETYEERAAIMEFSAYDVYPNRQAAERAAFKDLTKGQS